MPFFFSEFDSAFLDWLPHHRIHALAQLLAWLEMRHPFFGHHHLVAGLRVTTDARGAAVEREAAKPTDLDTLTRASDIASRMVLTA
jgi:hypothetical protein